MQPSASNEILLQRSRQLNRDERMPILRGELDQSIRGITASLEGLSGMDKDEKREEHIRNAIKGEAIPVPVIAEVAVEQAGTWRRPKRLISVDEPDEPYDLQDDDEAFLKAYNERWLPSRRAQEVLGAGAVAAPLRAEVMEEIVERLERLTGREKDLTKVVPLSTVHEELATVAPVSVLDAVHGYWYMKRLRLGKALLRANQTPPAWDDLNPFRTFRSRLETPNARRKQLRQDRQKQELVKKVRARLESAAELVTLVKKREVLKRHLVNNEYVGLEENVVPMVKRTKLEQEDFDFRMVSGLDSARATDFDPVQHVEQYRATCPDPDDLAAATADENACDGNNEQMPLKGDAKYLSHMRPVRLPGITPFLGIPRLSPAGQVVYDPVGVAEVRAWKDQKTRRRSSKEEMAAVLRRKLLLRLQQNPIARMQSIIASLSQPPELPRAPPDLEELQDFAEARGWDPRLVGQPPIQVETLYYQIPLPLKQKREQLM